MISKSIFFSYKTNEASIIQPLYERLKAEGYKVFMSSEDLVGGDIWPKRLVEEIEKSGMVLAFITQSYIDDCYQVDKELNIADKHKKPILPLLYKVNPRDIPIEWTYITKHQYFQITRLDNFSVDHIANICKKVLNEGKCILSPGDILIEAKQAVERHDWISAIKLFNEVSEALPDAYPQIVYCRLMLGQYPEARKAAQGALLHCPNNADSHFSAALANLAGRNEFPSYLLERVTEHLSKAWSIDAKLEQCYLAYIVGMLYKEQSYIVPGILQSMINDCTRYEYNKELMDKILRLIGK